MARRGLVAILVASIRLVILALFIYISLRVYMLRLRLRHWAWRRQFTGMLAEAGMPRRLRLELASLYASFLEEQRPRPPGLLELLGLPSSRRSLATLWPG